jgi:hypothetical protein
VIDDGVDPADPDWRESDPELWPAWTDAHRYRPTRPAAGVGHG